MMNNSPFRFNMAAFALFPADLTMKLSRSNSRMEQMDYLWDFADNPSTSKSLSMKTLELLKKMKN